MRSLGSLTSIQLSSFVSRPSSLALDPLTATLLLGGARSSVLLTAGRFLSSIFAMAEGRWDAEGAVVRGIRGRDQKSRVVGSTLEKGRGAREAKITATDRS